MVSNETDSENLSNLDLEQSNSALYTIRKEKLKELKETGKDPFLITKFHRTVSAFEVLENFELFENKEVSLVGRIVSWRDMGKASFLDLSDDGTKIQLYFKLDNIGEEIYNSFAKWDIGDIIGVKGEIFKTKRGEISVKVVFCTLLSKSLRPLPEKFHGIKDIDLRYRQRYLDLIMNPAVKNTFVVRSKIIHAIRKFLDAKGFLEVETPILQTLAGGAAARPFVTHHNALDLKMYLRIAPELYLKRLIVGGFNKVYELGRIFRNEGISIKHNPEFTMIELYEAYTDYEGIMNLTEELIKAVALDGLGTFQIVYNGITIDFSKPFERISMKNAVKKYASVDFNEIKTLEDAKRIADEHGVRYTEYSKKGDILSLFFEEYVEKNLVMPTFVTQHPVEISPFAKRCPQDPDFTERFELFIVGREHANAFSELNDPIDQAERFAEQAKLRQQGDLEANPADEDFVTALEYGLPPTGGLGIGIDRLVMLLTGAESIRDVLLFPTMKPLGGHL
ncbi:MAG: lysine--tRNA ligase [Oscillospiraceae bacterium]|nr:lysine--tRNA ligase [Oscillospiraceae bacterium]